MKKLLISFTALGLIGTPAFAADMAVKAPPPSPPPAPAYSWAGFYLGGNLGGTWNNDSANIVSTPVQGFGDGIGPGSFAANAAAGASGSVPLGNAGTFIGGIQAGYNWQWGAYLAGLEADFQAVGRTDTGGLATTVGPFPFFTAAEVINTQIQSSSRLDYFGTVRGRLGYLVTPALLAYGTGGLAYGQVKASTSISQSNNDCAAFPGDCVASNAFTSGSTTQTRTGWTAGGGLEWMFAQRWSAKVEYLYYDLGSVTFSNGNIVLPNLSCGVCGAGPAIIASQTTTKVNGNILRLGVNYHF
jgi:outer membrane immunogenic protein